MKPRDKVFLGLIIGTILGAVMVRPRRLPQSAMHVIVSQTGAMQRNEGAPTPLPATLPASTMPPVVMNNASFERPPFRPAIERDKHGWTAEDGRDTNVIRQLAHNNLEYERMLDENHRIKRRQLVYRNETVATLVQRARLSGEPLKHLILPALDGQEVDFEITRTDLHPSGQQGALAGHVAGRMNSMVTFAFKGGTEAFTVLSPSDGLYLQADPYEPGQIIVKSINPETYIVGVCGNP